MENRASLENQNRRRSKRYRSCYLEMVMFLQCHLNSVSLKSHDIVLTLASSYHWIELVVTLKCLVPLLSTSNLFRSQVLTYFITLVIDIKKKKNLLTKNGEDSSVTNRI